MKLLVTAFAVIVVILVVVFVGSYGVAKAFRHFGISEDTAFFVGIGAMLIIKGIVK